MQSTNAMDKLESETWEEYAFRYNFFKIKYVDKEKTIIADITIPNHDFINYRHYDSHSYTNTIECYGNTISNIGFMEFIMYELYKLRNKYQLGWYIDRIIKVDNMTTEREEDMNRQAWLFKELDFWERKYIEKTRIEQEQKKVKELERDKHDMRYLELKAIISETHKETLNELLTIIEDYPKPPPASLIWTSEYIDYARYLSIRRTENDKKMKEKQLKEQKERVELYQKYLKNKDIRIQMLELEKKLNQLKSELV